MFKDVPKDYWAAPYIEKAVKLGRMLGDKEGTFRPYSGVSRAEMAVILSRLPLSTAEMVNFGMPHVVQLKGRFGQHGSGFIYKGQYVITANHVLNESGANPPVAHLKDGRTSATTIVSRHDKADLAILKMMAIKDAPSLEIREKAITVGEFLQVLGFPGDLEWWAIPGFIEKPVVGNKNYEFNIKGYFEKGISGGLAIDEFGQAVGILIRVTGDCINLPVMKSWIEGKLK